METDTIIDELNRRPNISSMVSTNLEDINLSENEKALFLKYRPEKSLIIYGSLAPNRSNHAVVQPIRGKWIKGIVRGKRKNKGWGAELGFFGFTHAPKEEQEQIEAFVLMSDELVANWSRLDAFEGHEYRRILARYELENGETGVGFIYAVG